MSRDEQALDWFVREYPGRFSDPKYLHDERTYKWDAHLLFGLFADLSTTIRQ